MAKNPKNEPQDSLLQEIEGELKKERWLKLWNLYKKPIIYGTAAVVIVFAGGISYRNYRAAQLESWGDSYSRALDSIEEGSQQRALRQLQQLQTETSGYYEDLTQLQEAAVRSREGDDERAAAIYADLQLYSRTPLVRELATILWVYHQMDHEEPAQLRGRIQPFMSQDNTWHGTALELEALILLKEKKEDEAITMFEQIATTDTFPQGLRGRARDMLSWLGKPLDEPADEDSPLP